MRHPPTRSTHADAGDSSATFLLQPRVFSWLAGNRGARQVTGSTLLPTPRGPSRGKRSEPATGNASVPQFPRCRSQRPRAGANAASVPRTPLRLRPAGLYESVSKSFSSGLDRLQPFGQAGTQAEGTPGPATVREKAVAPVITDRTQRRVRSPAVQRPLHEAG